MLFPHFRIWTDVVELAEASAKRNMAGIVEAGVSEGYDAVLRLLVSLRDTGAPSS